jgi:hypothetical protein
MTEIQIPLAQEATKFKYSALLFGLRSGKAASARSLLAAMPLKALTELLDLDDLEDGRAGGVP